jgi:hypothetical protein
VCLLPHSYISSSRLLKKPPSLTYLYSVIITGVLRVAYGYKPGSQNVAFSKAELWSGVHVGIAIVCACLPTFRPLFIRTAASASSFWNRRYFNSSHLSSDKGRQSESISSNVLSTLESQDDSRKVSGPYTDIVELIRIR